MKTGLRRRLPTTVAAYVDERIVRWRTGTVEGQAAVLGVLAGLSVVLTVLSLVNYSAVPPAAFAIPMVLGTLLLRFRPLCSLVAVTLTGACVTALNRTIAEGYSGTRISTLVVLAVIAGILLYEASRHRSGLPGPLGELMLVELRDRLQRQGVVPTLPEGWQAQSAMLSAGGAGFAGDFMVADLSDDSRHLEMILVDVCGKGVSAGTASLQLAGALGGLIGALPPLGLFSAANDYLLRQHWEDGFATAVHVIVDLETGAYSIISAGHPPALHWDGHEREWVVDEARGTALGILERPEFHQTSGVLRPGEALLFYTDGVVENREQDVVTGIAWLRDVAKDEVTSGFAGFARRVMGHVHVGDDDRAVLVLDRATPPRSRRQRSVDTAEEQA